MTVGQKVSDMRREKRISQEELANALSVSRQTVSKWENDLMPISGDKRKELAEFFGVEDLVAEETAITHSDKQSFTANQKIIIAVIAVLIAISLAVTVIVGCVSIPNLRTDEKGATSLYVDFGYFWLALAITLIIAGIEVFAIFAYRKENLKKLCGI